MLKVHVSALQATHCCSYIKSMIKEGTVKITAISAKAFADPPPFSHLFDEINTILVCFLSQNLGEYIFNLCSVQSNLCMYVSAAKLKGYQLYS